LLDWSPKPYFSFLKMFFYTSLIFFRPEAYCSKLIFTEKNVACVPPPLKYPLPDFVAGLGVGGMTGYRASVQ